MNDVSVSTNEEEVAWDFLDEAYASMPAGTLLNYFRGRNSVKFFPLSSGQQKHVDIANEVINNLFCFNNERHQFVDGVDWKTNPYDDIEWLILLHKFYYARDLGLAYQATGDDTYANKWVELIASWINTVSAEMIDSQVAGRRLQQWILSYHYFVPGKYTGSISAEFFITLLKSIHDQALLLRTNLTKEGNHRTIELYAIFLVAIIFPEFKSSAQLLQFSKKEILKNLQQDFLFDGVHRELSTDYHHTVLKNFLRIRRLAELNSVSMPEEFDDLFYKVVVFSLYVHKPDGLIPAISDGDCNSYIGLLKKAHEFYGGEHLQYIVSGGAEGAASKCRSKGFEQSGYYILRSHWEHEPFRDAYYLFFDCAQLGFGSHGHYDLLNIEVAANGRSLVVDPGRYTYSEASSDGINWRKIFKGTAYHNTVVVDGKDQVRYCRGANIYRPPTPVQGRFVTAIGFDFVSGKVISDEYPVTHERKIFFLVSEYWLVIDVLDAESYHTYDLYFHLHPEAQGKTELLADDDAVYVKSPGLVLAQPRRDHLVGRIEEGFVSPSYGVKHRAPIVRFSKKTLGTALFHSLLLPCRIDYPPLKIEEIPVFTSDGRCNRAQATALKLSLTIEDKMFEDLFFLRHQAEDTAFHFNDVVFEGGLLFLRRDKNGRIVNMQADGLRKLSCRGQNLVEIRGGDGRFSTMDGVLHLYADSEDYRVSVPGFRQMVEHG